MKIAVAVIHGIGTQQETYADRFLSKLTKAVAKLNPKIELVTKPIWWQQYAEIPQTEIVKKTLGLGWSNLRNLFIRYGGDALGYQPTMDVDRGLYNRIHRAVNEGLQELYFQVDKSTPLVLVSHSLGTVIASNFIWDSQRPSSFGRLCFKPAVQSEQILRNLSLLYTMGSPIMVWGLRYTDGGAPIKVPDFCKWYNIYSPQDVISSPIKNINLQYKQMSNLEDISLPVGGFLTKFTPVAHVGYFEDKRVINHVSNSINRLAASISL